MTGENQYIRLFSYIFMINGKELEDNMLTESEDSIMK